MMQRIVLYQKKAFLKSRIFWSNVNCWVKSKTSNKKQKNLKKMMCPLESCANKFELFFDDEPIDFIVQMTNTYAIETNAVG